LNGFLSASSKATPYNDPFTVAGIEFVYTGGTQCYMHQKWAPEITRCTFRGAGNTGLYRYGYYNTGGTVSDCVFVGCATGFYNYRFGSATTYISGCTFVGCGTGVLGAYSGNTSISNSIFDGNTHHVNVPVGTTALDWACLYPFDASHDVVIGANTYTSLAALQAAGYNAHGKSQDVSYADEAIGDYHLAPTEPLKTGASDGSYLGAMMPAVMFSPNVNNAQVWSNPYGMPTNMEQDGSSFWVLTNPGSGTYTSQVIDLAGDENLRRVMPTDAGLANATTLDLTTGDYWWSIEWRYQTDVQGSFQPDAVTPAWTEFVWDRDMNVNARYVQLRVTPRTNGP